MSARVRPPVHPVTLTLDGEPFVAERGEPVAAALVAAGKLTIARSPKFHRPRGPSCMRAACDGCLARVDETPNIMTCMTAAEDGMAIVSQNRLGPREVDFLRMTDWFFPSGMNHHELFAGVPGIQNVMQVFARRVAGLGKLPVEIDAPRPAERRRVEAVVVGAGPSGIAVAAALARAGLRVEILDDQLTLGGSLRALAPTDAAEFAPSRRAFDDAVAAGTIRARTQTTAGGLYGRDLLVVGPEGAEILEARAIVLASGAHDGTLPFEGNDLPGVMSARAAGILLSYGAVPGEKIVVVIPPGGGPFGESFARAANGIEGVKITIVHGEPLAVRGTSRAKGIRVRVVNGDEVDFDADAVLIDAPRAPAYELGEQAGGSVVHEARGFVLHTEDGQLGEGIFASGEVVGVPFEARAIDADAARVAKRILDQR